MYQAHEVMMRAFIGRLAHAEPEFHVNHSAQSGYWFIVNVPGLAAT
jgi:hypothetical protein